MKNKILNLILSTLSRRERLELGCKLLGISIADLKNTDDKVYLYSDYIEDINEIYGTNKK